MNISASPPATGPVSTPFAAAQSAPDVPFSPRLLSRAEQRRGDLYLFASPKLGRRIEILHRARLAMALELEFAPDVVAWVERPRLLATKQSNLELCFWSRSGSGREQFLLFVDVSNTIADGKSRGRQHREARDLIEAANAACVSLEFVFEAALLERRSALTVWFRLLPYVQTAATLPHLDALERVVEETFAMQPRMSFLQLEQRLPDHAPPDVRAIACRLIHRGTLRLDTSQPLTRLSVLSTEAAP